VPAPAGKGPDVKMRIEIDDANGSVVGDIAEVMSEGGFMSAAQHNRDRTVRKDCRDDLTEGLLRLLKGAGDADVAEFEWGKQ
jgi:hypothetical protein